MPLHVSFPSKKFNTFQAKTVVNRVLETITVIRKTNLRNKQPGEEAIKLGSLQIEVRQAQNSLMHPTLPYMIVKARHIVYNGQPS